MDRPDKGSSDTSRRQDGEIRRERTSGVRIFLIAFVVFFGAGAIWSAATPLLAAPDEPSQIVKAASVVRGVWTARCYVVPNKPCMASTSSALGFEGLPTFYDLVRSPDAHDPAHTQTCFHRKDQGSGAIPASCARSLNRSPSAADIKGGYDRYSSSYQARYPPAYYAVVGLPALFPGSTIDLYLMRLVSAALAAIFLSLAFTAAFVYSKNRFLFAGLVVAGTPMVIFLGGVVNPSGLEIASAIALWTSGAILVTERLAAPPKGLVAIVGVSAVLLESVRPISPFWLLLTAAVLVLCAERRALGRALSARSVQICIGVVVILGVVSVLWIVALHSTDLYQAGNAPVPRSVSTATIFETALRRNAFYLPDMIGVFGWFDTYSPEFTFVIWYVLASLLIIGGTLASGRRGVLLLVMVVIVLVVPALIVTSHAHVDGYTWSGRDILPFAVGLPILSAALLGSRAARPLPTAVAQLGLPAVIVLAGIAQFVAFYEALRRYAVGTRGPVFGFILHPSWQPAIGVVGSLVLEIVALICLSTLYLWASLRPVRLVDEPACEIDA